MNEEFLTADFWDDFCCKMGGCRSACCVGWPISFSLDDYFKLAGLECSAEMRSRLDRGIRLALEPTEDCYAQIAPGPDGDCRMRLEDGRCSIHASLGEDALPQVCRLYPRAVRTEPFRECALANSCERVVEMLFEREKPIEFVRRQTDVKPPAQAKRLFDRPALEKEQEIRLWLIRGLQNRRRPLGLRLLGLYPSLLKLEETVKSGDAAALSALLETEAECPKAAGGDLAFALETAKALLSYLDGRSDGVKRYGAAAESLLSSGGNAQALYQNAAEGFEKRFPNWQVFFENLLVNHLFFEQFPCRDRPETSLREFLAVMALYATLRLVCVCRMADKEGRDELTDACAAVFRLAEHSDFHRYSPRLLEELGCGSFEKARSLALL